MADFVDFISKFPIKLRYNEKKLDSIGLTLIGSNSANHQTHKKDKYIIVKELSICHKL